LTIFIYFAVRQERRTAFRILASLLGHLQEVMMLISSYVSMASNISDGIDFERQRNKNVLNFDFAF